MGTLFVVVWIVSPSLFLFYRYIYDWHGKPSIDAMLAIGIGWFFLILLPVHVLLMASIGYDGLNEITPMRSWRGGGIATFYVFPALGFALASFPRVSRKFL